MLLGRGIRRPAAGIRGSGAGARVGVSFIARGAAGQKAEEGAGGETALARGFGFGAGGVESGDGVRECRGCAEVREGVKGG